MRHWAVLTREPNYVPVMNWLIAHGVRYELHLNRTRFWIADGPLWTEFCLRWAHCCQPVLEEEL